jgi:hypothetical protein
VWVASVLVDTCKAGARAVALAATLATPGCLHGELVRNAASGAPTAPSKVAEPKVAEEVLPEERDPPEPLPAGLDYAAPFGGVIPEECRGVAIDLGVASSRCLCQLLYPPENNRVRAGTTCGSALHELDIAARIRVRVSPIHPVVAPGEDVAYTVVFENKTATLLPFVFTFNPVVGAGARPVDVLGRRVDVHGCAYGMGGPHASEGMVLLAPHGRATLSIRMPTVVRISDAPGGGCKRAHDEPFVAGHYLSRAPLELPGLVVEEILFPFEVRGAPAPLR